MAILQAPWTFEPPVDYWEEYEKPTLISEIIKKFACDVMRRGDKTNYNDLYDYLYECIEEDIEKYQDEGECDVK